VWFGALGGLHPVASKQLLALVSSGEKKFNEGELSLLERGSKSVEDAEGCPAIALENSNLWLTPQVDEEMVRSGAWTTKDGGVLVKYTLDLFAYSFETIYLHLDHELFAVITPRINFDEVMISNNVTGFAIENCHREKMFELIELTKYEAYSHKMYDKDGKFIAYSRESKLVPSRLEFFDADGEPLAISQSPAITNTTGNILAKDPDSSSSHRTERVSPYETEFIVNNSSILGKPENRWLIMAALTSRALRNAMRAPNGKVVTPAAFLWFQLLSVIFLLLIGILFLSSLCCIYRCVYPLEVVDIQNTYLQKQPKMMGYGTTSLPSPPPILAPTPPHRGTTPPFPPSSSLFESRDRVSPPRGLQQQHIPQPWPPRSPHQRFAAP